MKEEKQVKGVYTVDNSHSVLVYDINYGIDDEVEWALSNDKDNIQTSVINYEYEDDEGPLEEPRAYFMVGDMRVYLDEVMRTDLTEGVEKLEEIEGPAELNQSVKQWLLREYPEEEDFIVDMPEDLTFNDVHEKMLNHEDIYETLNVGDSVIREKVFNGLVEATGYDYDYFYYLWLYGPEDERYLKYKTESKEIKEEDKNNWKSYVKDFAELSYETGHPYNDDDFEDFKSTLQDDGYNLTDSEYDKAWEYYWECFDECRESESEEEYNDPKDYKKDYSNYNDKIDSLVNQGLTKDQIIKEICDGYLGSAFGARCNYIDEYLKSKYNLVDYNDRYKEPEKINYSLINKQIDSLVNQGLTAEEIKDKVANPFVGRYVCRELLKYIWKYLADKYNM